MFFLFVLKIIFAEIDSVAQCHIQLAQTLREEARKMEEFREKQKLQRKMVGFASKMHVKMLLFLWQKTAGSFVRQTPWLIRTFMQPCSSFNL